MEIRIWLPESWPAWRYMLRNPSSFVIGAYGFKRWYIEHQLNMSLRSEISKKDQQLREKNEKIRELGKQLSELKRNK